MTPIVTAADRLRQVLASAILLTATLGVPTALSVLVGWPLPTSPGALDRLPLLLSQPMPSSAVVDVLAVVAWLAWLHFTAGIVVELVNATARRGRPQLRLPFGGPSHDLARSLVIAALLVGVAAPFAPAAAAPAVASTSTAITTTSDATADSGPAASAGGEALGGIDLSAAGTDAATHSATTTTAMTSTTATTASSTGPGVPAREEQTSEPGDALPEYVVPAPAAGRYACLWDIAEQQLGDGTRWTEIHDLNVGRTQPDGQALTDPDHIHPGWRLRLPPDAQGTGSRPAATPIAGGHVVVAGDTLWDIAENELGDGARYDELAAAAATITQPDGQTLHDPDLLQPGWTIPIPGDEPAVDERPVPIDQPVPTPDSVSPEPVPPQPQNESAPALPGVADDVLDAGEQAGDGEEETGPGDRSGSVDATSGQSAVGGPVSEVDAGRAGAEGADAADEGGEGDTAGPSWALAGLSGAGTMLAGALLLLLHQVQRRQRRLRRPGRALVVPGPEHAVVEKSVRAHANTATTIQWLDQVLRRLASARLLADDLLPEVTAVTLDRSGATLHLAQPGTLAEPWTSDGSSWHLVPDADLDQVGPLVPDQPAPFPLLVTVGATLDGATSMLNLEHLGAATITGDCQRGEDLLRYVAAELGCNPWSETVRVHCVGVARELGPLNPDRLHVSPMPSHGEHDRASGLTEPPASTDSAGSGPGLDGSLDPVADVMADAVAAVDRSVELGTDVPNARIRQAADETWPPRVLLIDASRRPPTLHTLTDLIRTHPSRTGAIVLQLNTPDAGTDTDTDTKPVERASDGIRLHLSSAGHLTVTGGTDLVPAGVTAAGLSRAEAQGCAALYALGPADAPMPALYDATDGWRAYADAAGALMTRHTLPRVDSHPPAGDRGDTGPALRAQPDVQPDINLQVGPDGDSGWLRLSNDQHQDQDQEHDDRGNDDRGNEENVFAWGNITGGNDEGYDDESQGYGEPGDEEPDATQSTDEGRDARRAGGAASLLGASDEEYLDVAATTREDLDALAPRVPDDVRRVVAESDPGLDDDVAAWFTSSCALPRLTLLGPVGARTRGVPVTKRKPYYTELLAYLATRPHGATPEEVAAAFDITPTKARGYVGTVREWLGTNPRTGRVHVPDARHSPAAEHRGVGVYEVEDLLVDADLFRRLRLRGQTRGPDGIQDLQRALTLVTGPPFSKLRPGGWTWLAEGDRLDQHMLCAIVDVAHLVTTHLLQTGDLSAARATAELAALAAPDEEIPRLDLAAVAMASGHRSAAADIVHGDICNRTDDAGPPEELSARTQEILDRQGWLTGPRQAAS